MKIQKWFALGVLTIGLAWGGQAVWAFKNAAAPSLADDPTELALEVGTWDADCKMWEGPDAEPFPFKGTEVNTMLGGSTWVVGDFKSDFSGQEFRGHSQTGYDPEKKKVVGTWIDTMSTHMVVYEGTYDAATKTRTVEFDNVDPTGKKLREKHEIKYNKDGSRVMTAFATDKETKKSWKSMEIVYTKRK